MRTPRMLVLIFFLVTSLFLLFRSIAAASRPRPYWSSASPAAAEKPTTPISTSSTPASNPPNSGISAFFSFHTPFSLFSPNAAISLTDDNSTSFPAQPAAFGPNLPRHGLSGRLWVGSGFAEETEQGSSNDAELGCGDIPGWKDGQMADDTRMSPGQPGGASDGHSFLSRSGEDTISDSDSAAQSVRRFSSDDDLDDFLSSGETGPTPAGIQFLQESREISGRIALLRRGGCGFLEKVLWAQRRGATALIVGDDRRGGPLIQMFAKGDTSNVTIPSVFAAWTTAHLLSSLTQPGSYVVDSTDQNGQPTLKVRHSSGGASEQLATAEGSTVASRSGMRAEHRSAGGGHTAAASKGSFFSRMFREYRRSEASRTFVPGEEVSASRLSSVDSDVPTHHDGLWVTITPSNAGSPFFDTLLVLVASPLVTLTFVYALLIVRARYRRRRWRAPKSVVERLPVRTYHTVAPSPLQSPRVPSPDSSSPSAPLLQGTPSRPRPRSRTTTEIVEDTDFLTASSAIPTPHSPTNRPEHEKPPGSVSSEWKKYMGRQVECVVCLEEYVDGVSQVMSLPCGHEFHAECITPWLTTRRRTCPICKGDVVRSLARGSPSSPRYEPYRDDSEGDDEPGASGSGGQDDDAEQGILSPAPRRRQTRAEAWLGLLSSSFGERSISGSESSVSGSPADDRDR